MAGNLSVTSPATASRPTQPEYAVVAYALGALEVLAECATAGDAVAAQRDYPGSLLAHKDGRRWIAHEPARRAGAA